MKKATFFIPSISVFNLFGFHSDLTTEIDFILPYKDQEFSAASPHLIKVDLEIFARACLNQQRTSGKLFLNGVQVASWNESKSTSHPFRIEFDIPISSGLNTLVAQSDNGDVTATRTVVLVET